MKCECGKEMDFKKIEWENPLAIVTYDCNDCNKSWECVMTTTFEEMEVC
tara:strand:- start:654 stop:800 length:147 start_codon:yes stop_codon:yes gene_type:complete